MIKLRFVIFLFSIIISSSIVYPSINTRQTYSYSEHYVVVIGAFALHENAERFTDYASEQSTNAKFEFNPDKNLYYVFTLKTNIRTEALEEVTRLREQTSFTDAWVYPGELGSSAPVTQTEDINSNDQQKLAEVTEIKAQEPTAIVEKKSGAINPDGSKKFIFQLYRSTDNETVVGDVEVIDPDKTKKLASYASNQPVLISSPDNVSGNLTLVANVFGYRKIQKDLNFNKPEGDVISTDDQSAYVIPFELVRLFKGDIVVMYNVFFYKDAAVMMPESQYEVNSLLQMMKENPKCKIALHGHTNGGASGKIISKGDSKNFFSLTGSKSGFGSANNLSEERASIIKDYLVDNGIDPERMKVHAWGGKRPLYDKDGAQAKQNVRVEVEILEN